jgi:exonuclease 1
MGNHREAQEAFQRAVDISPAVAQGFIQVSLSQSPLSDSNRAEKQLEMEGIEYIVAPYEADAQLAFLSSRGIVDVVISEDSDLLPYGCHVVLYKLDHHGAAQQIRLERLQECERPLSFAKFTVPMFRQMCILSGCDYLPSAKGLGIRSAYNLVLNLRDSASVLSHIMESRAFDLPAGYEEGFEQAELTFMYQRVWDPLTQQIVHLNPLPVHLQISDLDFLGPSIDNGLGYRIAKGLANPHNHQDWKAPMPSAPKRSQPNRDQVGIHFRGTATTGVFGMPRMLVPKRLDLYTSEWICTEP